MKHNEASFSCCFLCGLNNGVRVDRVEWHALPSWLTHIPGSFSLHPTALCGVSCPSTLQFTLNLAAFIELFHAMGPDIAHICPQSRFQALSQSLPGTPEQSPAAQLGVLAWSALLQEWAWWPTGTALAALSVTWECHSSLHSLEELGMSPQLQAKYFTEIWTLFVQQCHHWSPSSHLIYTESKQNKGKHLHYFGSPIHMGSSASRGQWRRITHYRYRASLWPLKVFVIVVHTLGISSSDPCLISHSPF